jgi:hypothetical protein
MNADQQVKLYILCEFPKDQKWELKYRASRDGFKGTDFHAKCDGVPNTLSVIKSTHGNIFGGLTEKPWTSHYCVVSDPKAYIFSLINQENKPFKSVCSNRGAIRCRQNFGPTFGDEDADKKDIWITSESNSNEDSSSNFGSRFEHPDYVKGTKRANTILAGSNKFRTLEIEVFTKTN